MSKQSSRKLKRYWDRALRTGYFEGGDVSLEGLASLWGEYCRVQGRPAVAVATAANGLGSLTVGIGWLDVSAQEVITSMLRGGLEASRSEAGNLLSTGLMPLGQARGLARKIIALPTPNAA